eukprot:412123-Rhodomonas_salina.1
MCGGSSHLLQIFSPFIQRAEIRPRSERQLLGIGRLCRQRRLQKLLRTIHHRQASPYPAVKKCVLEPRVAAETHGLAELVVLHRDSWVHGWQILDKLFDRRIRENSWGSVGAFQSV